jgi:hypothetical protein
MSPNKSLERTKPVRMGLEHGFVDLGLPLAQIKRESDGRILARARRLLQGKSVAFSVRLAKSWAPQQSDGFCAYWGSAEFESVGPERSAA